MTSKAFGAQRRLVARACGAAAAGSVVAVGVGALPAAAQIAFPLPASPIVLPANEEWFTALFDLGNSPGGRTFTLTSSREISWNSSNLYEQVEEHLHANSGWGGYRHIYRIDNVVFENVWAHGFTFRYIDHQNEYGEGCCWPDTETGEWVGYHTDSTYNTLLMVDFGFAPGAGPIEVGFAQASVPEPAIWAMMIVGFGVAGNAVRQARKRPSEFGQRHCLALREPNRRTAGGALTSRLL